MPIHALLFPMFSLAGPEPVVLSDRLADQIDQIYGHLGGRFDVLQLGHNRMLWINREPERFQVNPSATLEAACALARGQLVRGPALLTGWDGCGELRQLHRNGHPK